MGWGGTSVLGFDFLWSTRGSLTFNGRWLFAMITMIVGFYLSREALQLGRKIFTQNHSSLRRDWWRHSKFNGDSTVKDATQKLNFTKTLKHKALATNKVKFKQNVCNLRAWSSSLSYKSSWSQAGFNYVLILAENKRQPWCNFTIPHITDNLSFKAQRMKVIRGSALVGTFSTDLILGWELETGTTYWKVIFKK